MQSSKLGCPWKVYERGTNAVKNAWVYKRVRGGTSGRSLPVQNFLHNPPGLVPPRSCLWNPVESLNNLISKSGGILRQALLIK